MSKRIDLTGQKFERLKVISYAGMNKNRKALWECECKCGNVKIILGESLRLGKTKSCGCLSNEKASKALHDFNTTHGESRTRIYTIWNNMMQRVLNKNNKRYKDYGGRGIGICEDWKDFENFRKWALVNGYNDELTLDREDNDGDYCPQNCRWVDWDTQRNNKQQSRKINYKGETKTITQWAKECGISRETIRDRINAGWSIEKALETPARKKKV
ncbi:AP2 domain-containing protein [Lachnospiraceae bacterium 29-84]